MLCHRNLWHFTPQPSGVCSMHAVSVCLQNSGIADAFNLYCQSRNSGLHKLFFRCKSTKVEGRSKERKRKDSEESRAAAPFGFHVVLPDMRGRVRGNGSTSINSFYITSLCWCQVAERKGRKESALTLFFSVFRPHLALLLLCLIPLRVCLYGYRQILCLPNTTGGSLRCSSLFSLVFSFPVTITSFSPWPPCVTSIHNVIPSILPLLSSLFKFCQNTYAALIRQPWFCHHQQEGQHRKLQRQEIWLYFKVNFFFVFWFT